MNGGAFSFPFHTQVLMIIKFSLSIYIAEKTIFGHVEFGQKPVRKQTCRQGKLLDPHGYTSTIRLAFGGGQKS